MNTTQPQTVIPLEEVITGVQEWGEAMKSTLGILAMTADLGATQELGAKYKLLTSTLHHLEAQRKECGCHEWKEFSRLLRPVKVAEHADGSSTWKSTCPTPDFCPWCGGKVSSTNQP